MMPAVHRRTTPDCIIVAYHGRGRRSADEKPYQGSIASTYVQQDGTYDLRGQRFVHFAAAKAHVAVYGLVHTDGDVPPELAPYLVERSTLRFPLDQPLPTGALEAALRDKAVRLDETG